MDEITITEIMWFIGCVLVGFFIKTMWERISVLNRRVDNWSTVMPETYVRRDDYRDDIRDIKEMLGKIFDRLEMKADK